MIPAHYVKALRGIMDLLERLNMITLTIKESVGKGCHLYSSTGTKEAPEYFQLYSIEAKPQASVIDAVHRENCHPCQCHRLARKPDNRSSQRNEGSMEPGPYFS